MAWTLLARILFYKICDASQRASRLELLACRCNQGFDGASIVTWEERHMLETVARFGQSVMLVTMVVLTFDIYLLR